jgi:rod shape-determining protein MreB
MLLWKLYLKPPELAADIYNTGIYLAGGGSMLRIGQKNFKKQTYLFTLQKILYER